MSDDGLIELPRGFGVVRNGMGDNVVVPPVPATPDALADVLAPHLDSASGGVVMIAGFLGPSLIQEAASASDRGIRIGFKSARAAAQAALQDQAPDAVKDALISGVETAIDVALEAEIEQRGGDESGNPDNAFFRLYL